MQNLFIVAIPPSELLNEDFQVVLIKEGYKFSGLELPFTLERVKILKPLSEMKEKKKAYRKSYAQRPDVKAKQKERMKKPETVEKRRAYSKREEVQKRKREVGAIKRHITSLLKQRDPNLYNEIYQEIDHKRLALTTKEESQSIEISETPERVSRDNTSPEKENGKRQLIRISKNTRASKRQKTQTQ